MGCCLLDEEFISRFYFRIRSHYYVATLSKECFKMKQHLQSKQIALMGMLMALQLIVTRF